MKKVLLLLLLFTVKLVVAQSDPQTTVEVKLFLPANIRSEISPNDTLFVYLVSEKPGEKMVMLRARHHAGNVYTFPLKYRLYPRISYRIANYRSHTVCINNREGQAPDNHSFNILLEEGTLNPDELKFIPPCMLSD